MSEREQLEQAIAALEAQRATLGDVAVDAAIAGLRQKLAELEAPPATRRGEQQRKQVTVLFADVSGFTAMSETMDAEDVTDIMNALWTRLDRIIIEHGGIIDKHIGDAVMALWGAEIAREDDAERAIHAALAMQAALTAFRDERQVALAVRTGINTGPVLLGAVGTTAEYTAMGDTVNLASRLEEAAPVGQIFISHDTYRHVRGVFDVRVLEPIQVKGKKDPVQVYVVERAKPRAFRLGTRGVEGVETRMIGREAELQRLQNAFYATLENGETHVVTVVGDAGVGKSRLLYEFRNWLALQPESMMIFNGRVTQELSKLPYALIRALFTFRFEIRDSDPPGVAREKLVRGIIESIGAGSGSDGQMQAHFIGHLIGFDFSASPHLQGILTDPRQIHDRAFFYVTQFFRAVATSPTPASGKREGVAIYLDDIHWADEGSLDLIDHLARMCSDVPLLIVCLTRPSLFRQRPSWGERWTAHTRLELRPLSKQNSRRLVLEILQKAPEIPPILRELITRRAEGNPFYIEELIKVLIDDGIIVAGADWWKIESNRLAESRVPSTLTAVLQARLDRLPPWERDTMQRASVVGRIFWADAVAYLGQDGAEFGASSGESHNGKRGLEDALETLQGRELVFRRQASAFAETWEYTFKHAILHEVTYESVLKRLRRRYHARAAAWLTEQGRERVEQYAGLIGDHYEQAGEVMEAAKWYGQAGRRAQETCANETALKWYNRTLELVEQLGPEQASELGSLQLSVHGSLGDVLTLMGWYDEALEHYAAARSLLEAETRSPDQARRLADLCRQTAEVCERRSEYECASEWLKRGLSYLDESEPTIETARIYLLRAGVYHRQGRSDKAIDWSQKGITVASEIRTREGLQVVARAYYLLGSIYRLRGDLLRAVRFCRESVQLYQQIEDLAGQSNAYNNLAIAYFEQGDWTEASAVYHESLAIRRKVGDVYGHGVVANNLASIHLDRGEWIQAAGLYEQSYAIGRQIGAASLEALALSNLAQVHIYQENWAKARDCLSRSQALFIEIGSDEFLPELERRWGELYLRSGELDQALDHARRSIALASAQSNPLEAGMSCRVLGRVHMARDEWEPAEAVLRQSLEILGDLNSEYEVAKTRLSLARLALETGATEEGQAHLAQAIQTFEKLGAQADLAAAREVGKSL